MARKRISARETATREARESLAMVRAQVATMEAALKGMKLSLRELEKRVAAAGRLEVLDDAKGAEDP